jgi:[methyl-Co(III) methanol-specific corrinoid protein]:coenzyme M methyltransferase
MYRDFLQPIHEDLIAALDCPLVLHICGDTLDRIGFIADAGFAAFHFDSKVDARAAVQAAGPRLGLVGNVNNPVTLLTGTPDAVAAEARYARDAGVRVIGPECAVPLHAPMANLRAIAEAVRP